ncbi:hypothetical protein Zm00014a_014485 [Zea mays]|jgi:hypothetical protein|uniref:F-box protein n=2 Tax=Zea mays TaxID=4577 RepID=A0A1D6GSL5_MAIZE|nr:uncharacterized protein LOC103626276 [Zea mays]AQK66015.1 hypothetical protein ZEAMMB73_Zm00001d014351 [Zea mays]PWZ22505.1 hypothetical protein Zm00014a_014485 [Zea mays]|eukprot:XP_008644887.1 uncharacterized protein LOC103626276 [Zea mays]
MASLLQKSVDAVEWDAEDISGRLGLVLHAAFLFAGFQPYGRQPRSGYLLKKQSRKRGGSACLSRLYTAPELAQREGADAAVLMLCVQGSNVALLVFITTDGDDTPEDVYLEHLDLEIVRPLLSRSLGGVEPWASRICKSLANGVCWCFLDKLCRRNGLALSGFSSLHDDLKAVVLAKLTDGKDLARVECVSSQLRLLVAERDHELWRTLYKALPAGRRRGWWWSLRWFLPNAESSDDETLDVASTWKDKYVEAMRRPYPYRMSFRSRSWYFDPVDWRRDLLSQPLGYWFVQDPPEEDEEKTNPPRVDRSGGGHRRKLARNDFKKWHGGGAIHSPSSRYRWKHR